jgi:signal transduction histidine kinase
MTRKFDNIRGLAGEDRRRGSLPRPHKLINEDGEDLRKAIQAKSELVAHVSHELRTPLNVIIGFAELLLEEVPGKINDEQRKSLDDILSSSRRLLDLVNEKLDRYNQEPDRDQQSRA